MGFFSLQVIGARNRFTTARDTRVKMAGLALHTVNKCIPASVDLNTLACTVNSRQVGTFTLPYTRLSSLVRPVDARQHSDVTTQNRIWWSTETMPKPHLLS